MSLSAKDPVQLYIPEGFAPRLLRNRGWGRFLLQVCWLLLAFPRNGNQVGWPVPGDPLARQGAYPPREGQRVPINETGEGRRFLQLEKGDRL